MQPMMLGRRMAAGNTPAACMSRYEILRHVLGQGVAVG